VPWQGGQRNLGSGQRSGEAAHTLGGHIVLDLTDVSYVDSSGLGTLVGLKVSAVKEGYCKLELVNLSSRVKELLRLSNLTQLFAS
jgi:anti-anti-sigma factor